MEPQISPSFGYVKTLLKYLLISAQASIWVLFSCLGLSFMLKKKTYLQAPSLASFKWHLAVNETNFAFIFARNLCINLRGCCQIMSWEREWWGMENSAWKSITVWNRREKLTSDWWTLCTEHIKPVYFLRGFGRREKSVTPLYCIYVAQVQLWQVSVRIIILFYLHCRTESCAEECFEPKT